MKICKQCGQKKELSEYRNYYNGRTGQYSRCKECEKINSRCKYLRKKERSANEQIELDSIEELYELQVKLGFSPPNSKVRTPLDIEAIKQQYIQQVAEEIPEELSKWLTEPLTEEPDVYLDIYDTLVTQYAPVIRFDPVTYLPVYDEKHRPTLRSILDRFNEYEDSYYGGD